MKTNLLKISLLIMTLTLTGTGCEKKEEILKTGNVIFYTNAQAIVNCGPFNVEIYLDNHLAGMISTPFTEDTQPDCINSTATTMLEKKEGQYNYTAKMNCGQYGEWSGEFEITPGICTFVYLDINQCAPKND